MNNIFTSLVSKIYSKISRRIECYKSLTILNEGHGKINKKSCMGGGNFLTIKKGCELNSPIIHIIGHNNSMTFGEGCKIGPFCSFWIEGDNIKINIGANCTFTNNIHINAQEDNMYINIGEDVMFSNHIIVRTSDSHPIYSMESNDRLNKAKPVIIGNHVWIAPNSEIMKGAIIGNGAIVGSQTTVNNTIPENCLAVGRPAKIVRSNIYWTREDIIFKKTM